MPRFQTFPLIILIMQIGILQCDNVRSSLRPTFGEYPQMFIDGLQSVNDDSPLSFRIYPAFEGVLPDKPEECDAYIVTGSRYSVLDSEVLWIHQLQNFIIRLHKAMIKTIGVCFGHQVIAVALGGKVERADCGWQIGVHKTQVVQHSHFMHPQSDAFHIAMFCEDQVVKIDSNAIVLARTDSCAYAMLQYGEHMMSLQGHPEFTCSYAKSLLTVCQGDFPNRRFELGIKSFTEQPLDSDLLLTWLLHFLRGEKQ